MEWETRALTRAGGALRNAEATEVLPAIALPPTARPRLVASAQRPTGSVREFIATAFEVSIGSKVGMTSAYLAYVTRCKARDRATVSPEQFFEATDQVCRVN